MSHRLLQGTRVIESSAFIAAPLCGMALAQLGADVIRIDLIGGGIDYKRLPMMPGGRSLYWTSLNRGKRSIAIDIRKPEGQELVRSLATAPGDGGGILLTNIPTGWLSHATLAERRPDMISCTIEGNADGSTAVDYTVNCATGYPALTGDGSREQPVNHALPAWDVTCAYQAAFSLAAAVDNRRRTGAGSELRIALSDVAFSVMSSLGVLAEAELLHDERRSIGNDIYGAFGRDFATGDGERIMVAAVSARQWTSLVNACNLGESIALLEQALRADFNEEADRFEYRDVIAGLIKRWCAARTLSDIAGTFDRFGVCWGQYRTVRELLAKDPRVSVANPIFGHVDTPGVGRHLAAGSPVRIRGSERDQPQAAPLLGDDTDGILKDVLGFDALTIAGLHGRGIVAGPERDPYAATLEERRA